MPFNYMSQEELQHIEHCNKALLQHKEIVALVINETESLLNNYLPILSTYVNSVVKIRTLFGEEVSHVMSSTRQLKMVTNSTQEVINFADAVIKLNAILTPSLVEKLNRLLGEDNV